MQIHRHYCKDLYGEPGEYRNSDGSALSKTMFYTKYLADLSIVPSKDDQNLAFITHEEKELLDRYHAARLQGKSVLQKFLEGRYGDRLPVSELVLERPETTQSDAVFAIVEALSQRITPIQTPVAQLRERIELLSDLCDRQISLPTSDLKMLLDRSTISGAELSAYGFLITRTDQRQAGQSLWQISKP